MTACQSASIDSQDRKKKWFPAGKQAQKFDPELAKLSNAYFWERRNVLLQLLASYQDDSTLLIRSTSKSGRGKKLLKTRGSHY